MDIQKDLIICIFAFVPFLAIWALASKKF